MQEGLPIRIFIFTPFIALVLVMVGATAIVALQTADDDAAMLATRLHQAMSANIRMRLDDYLARSPSPTDAQRDETLVSLLRSQAVGTNGRAFILDTTGKIVASSASAGDPVVESAVAALARHTGPSGLSAAATEFQFDHVTAKPLSRETWLTYATAYRDDSAGHDWILVTAMPEAFYLAGLRKANSRSAMVFALALVLSLVLGAALASMVTAPLRHMAHATRTMARGDLSVRVPGSKLEELDALAESFNAMAARLKKSFDDLVGEVETRKSRERELKESEARLRVERRAAATRHRRGRARHLGLGRRAGSAGVGRTRCTGSTAFARMSSVALSTHGRGASCRKTSRGPMPTSRPRFAASASSCPTSGCGERTAPSAPFAAWRKPSETRTAGPCAWSASTGMSRI